MATVTVNSSYGALKYYANDYYIVNECQHTGQLFEQKEVEDVLLPFVRRANIILDVGAHCGTHSLIYSSVNPQAQIHAFEPQHAVYRLLTENLQARSHVKTYNKAVANRNLQTMLARASTDGPNNHLQVEYGTNQACNIGGVSLGIGGETVETIRIDDLGLPGCDFIKIDVEGAEPLVVLGGEETIRRYRPVIYYEANWKVLTPSMKMTFAADQEVPSVEELLRTWGYRQFQRYGQNILAQA
jgi:FkbM family methyltransferase